ncbi:MAG: cupin domain-containing protein, partial [Alphaproteobacteria bacterium]|nr:cupin domain-containing protein [Alphaproteobacteria bacterium]
MDRAHFQEQVEKDGYKVKEKTMVAGTINLEHTHPFDAQLFVLSGHITIGQDDRENIFGPGDICSVEANIKHSEKVGVL